MSLYSFGLVVEHIYKLIGRRVYTETRRRRQRKKILERIRSWNVRV